MKKKKLIMLLLLISSLWIGGCGGKDEKHLIEDEDEKQVTDNPIEDEDGNKIIYHDPDNLIIGKWKLVDWYNDTPLDINKDGNASTDLYSQWNGCFKHSTIEFFATLKSAKVTYTGPNNNLRCPPNSRTNDFYYTFPWRITNPPWVISNNQILTFMGDDFLEEYEIIELSTITLILEGSYFLTCCDESISYYTGGFLKFIKVQ
jgi:hypothetical protein